MPVKLLVNSLLLLLLSLIFQSNLKAEGPYKGHFVDAYSLFDGSNEDPSIIIDLMKSDGVKHTVVCNKAGGFHAQDGRTSTGSGGITMLILEDMARKYSKELIPLAVSNLGKYKSNDEYFEDFFYKHANEANYRGVGETPIYIGNQDYGMEWVSEPSSAPFSVPFDDDRVSIVTGTAKSEKWPMHLWINFADMPDAKRDSWMRSFKKYLKDNQDVIFLLMHVGTLPSNEVATLIAEHPNLYFLLSRTTPDFESMGTKYTMILDQNGTIKSDWKALFVEHPDRFLVAFYTFGIDWGEWYPRIVYVWRNILAELPEKTAHALAHGNAERIYKIKVENKDIANAHFESNTNKLTKNNMSVSGQ